MSYFERYFDVLLKSRKDDEWKYLWELKLNYEEYGQLKEFLKNKILNTKNASAIFEGIERECVLYFAEFWKREYNGGSHSKEIVYDSLNTNKKCGEICESFFQAAKKGAYELSLDIYSEETTQYLDSILYQGGLPINYITANNSDGTNWNRFVRGLVFRRYDFEDLKLGKVASNSVCLINFCAKLVESIEKEDCSIMPFYCQDENDNWYRYLIEVAKEEKRKQRTLHPFNLDYEFDIDNIEKTIKRIYCIFSGPHKLSPDFLIQEELPERGFFTVHILNNEVCVAPFDYINNFCKYSVKHKQLYKNGDKISIYLHNQNNPHKVSDLDTTIPHLLYRENNKYKLGNKLGERESILLFNEEWMYDGKLDIIDYSWEDLNFKCIRIPSDFTDIIQLKQGKDTITFGKEAPLFWTEIETPPLYIPQIIEPIYNINKSRFSLYRDNQGEEPVKQNLNSTHLIYKNRYESEWSNDASFGEIQARIRDNDNYVTPVKFINIGNEPEIEIIEANENSCKIKIKWDHGTVSTTQGKKINEDVWEFEKKSCDNSKIIKFIFKPTNNPKNQFSLSINAPYKTFSITNNLGKEIETNGLIPYSELETFRYNIVGYNNIEYSIGNISRRLGWNNNQLCVTEQNNNERRIVNHIPYSGKLLELFDSKEQIRAILDKTSKSIVRASVDIQFSVTEQNQFKLSIKDNPYNLRPTNDERLVMTIKKRPLIYEGLLKCFKINEREKEPIELHGIIDEEKKCSYYTLTEELKNSGIILVAGDVRGKVTPMIVNKTEDYNKDNVTERFSNSKICDDLWKKTIYLFEITRQYEIPANLKLNTVLELKCIAENPKYLLLFAFQMYLKTPESELDILKEHLKSFSTDFAFQWYWLIYELYIFRDYLNEQEINDTTKTFLYLQWVGNHHFNDSTYISNINNLEPTRYLDKPITEFTTWMKEVLIASLSDSYSPHDRIVIAENIINYQMEVENEQGVNLFIDINQNKNDLTEGSTKFFNNYSEEGRWGNEQWFYQRLNAVLSHLQNQINLLKEENEIRRSIIFCSKSCNELFLIRLNNKLRNI